MTKKLFSVILALCLLLGTAGAAPAPGPEVTGKGYATPLEIPEEYLSYLPETMTYEGGVLTVEPTDAAPTPEAEALWQKCHTVVEEFLRNLVYYGSGNQALGSVEVYTAMNSPVQRFLNGAYASLMWTVHVVLTIQNLAVTDYVPLGENAFLCLGHVDFNTSTYYQKRDVSMDYHMLWINQWGYWRLWDLAYGEYSCSDPTAETEPEEPDFDTEPTPEEKAAGYTLILGREEGLTVARIQGKRFLGYIAVVDDPMRLYVGTLPYFSEGSGGRTVKQMADDTGAVLGINGGGFKDDNGMGSGGIPMGNLVADGEMRWPGGGPTVAMDRDGKLFAGEIGGDGCRERNFLWALAYGPILIEDGAIRPYLESYYQEPRTAVGQRADGSVVLLNIQGRQASALGVTCQELAEIMLDLGCINAGNLDGGASSDMYYRGEYVNICNTSGGPRPLPSTLLVAPVGGRPVQEDAQG